MKPEKLIQKSHFVWYGMKHLSTLSKYYVFSEMLGIYEQRYMILLDTRTVKYKKKQDPINISNDLNTQQVTTENTISNDHIFCTCTESHEIVLCRPLIKTRRCHRLDNHYFA